MVLRCLKLLISHMFPAWPCPCVITPSRLGAMHSAQTRVQQVQQKPTVAIFKLCRRNIISANQRRQI